MLAGINAEDLNWCLSGQVNLHGAHTQTHSGKRSPRARAHAEAAGVRGRGAQRGALQRGQARADLHTCVLHALVHLRRRRAHVVQHVDRQAACATAYLRMEVAALSVQQCELRNREVCRQPAVLALQGNAGLVGISQFAQPVASGSYCRHSFST